MATVNVSIGNTTVINVSTNTVISNTVNTIANTITSVIRIVMVGGNSIVSMPNIKTNVQTGVMIKTRSKKT